MARYLYKLIAPAEISSSQPFCFRGRMADAALQSSIRRHGIIQPLILMPHSRELISGYRRLEIARELFLEQVPVMELDHEPSRQDAFLLAVLSNWGQPFSEIERAAVISSAKHVFGFDETEILAQVFPALKLNPDKNIYQEAIDIACLDAAIVELIKIGELPFRGARILSRFNADDQKNFARVLKAASLTTSQLLKAGEWLFDLLRIEKVSLECFFYQSAMKVLLMSDQPRNSKGEELFLRIRALRFPKVAEREREFLALSSQFRDEKMGLSLETPPFFEEEGFTLKAKLKGPESLETVIAALNRKRKVLNSLLDIVL